MQYTPLFSNEPDFAGQHQTRRFFMALQDRLDAFKADFESGRFPQLKPTKEMLDIMHRATDELIAGAQAHRARKAGEVAPEFTLTDSDGKPVSSRERLPQGALLGSF